VGVERSVKKVASGKFLASGVKALCEINLKTDCSKSYLKVKKLLQAERVPPFAPGKQKLNPQGFFLFTMKFILADK